MTSKVDLAGQRFGRLVAIKPVIKNGRQAWLCHCDCGNTKIVRADHLRSGAVKSCGCLNADKKKERFKDMTDFENDNFKVIEKVESHNQRVQWLCLCKHCGNTTVLNSSEIAKTKSCGCLKKGASAEYMAQIRDFESLKSTKPTKKNTTGVRGVYVRNRQGTRKYQAFINVNKKPKYLGTFASIEEAAKARKQAEQDFWGK